LILGLLLFLVPASLPAQGAGVLLNEGVRAYTDLDFAAAAQLLRRALDPQARPPLSAPDRLRALMYLGAALLFRDEQDQAVTAFRTLVTSAPRFRPDTLVFPPRVAQAFAEVLQTTKAVGLTPPTEVRFTAGSAGLVTWAYATSRHQIDARIAAADGAVAGLYRGVIQDSVELSWSGLDSSGSVVAPGRYALVVTSFLGPDQVLRSVRVPLDLTVRAADTLPWPPEPMPRRSGWNLGVLLPGLGLGAALAGPAAAGVGGAEGVRIGLGLSVVAVSLAIAKPQTSPASARTLENWRSRLKLVQQENERRAGHPTILIRTGAPERREGPPE
jgi:hypothetical protein